MQQPTQIGLGNEVNSQNLKNLLNLQYGYGTTANTGTSFRKRSRFRAWRIRSFTSTRTTS